MYDPTYAHKITMTLYEDRLRLAAAGARTQPDVATGALRAAWPRRAALLGRAVPRGGRRASRAPRPAAEPCIP